MDSFCDPCDFSPGPSAGESRLSIWGKSQSTAELESGRVACKRMEIKKHFERNQRAVEKMRHTLETSRLGFGGSPRMRLGRAELPSECASPHSSPPASPRLRARENVLSSENMERGASPVRAWPVTPVRAASPGYAWTQTPRTGSSCTAPSSPPPPQCTAKRNGMPGASPRAHLKTAGKRGQVHPRVAERTAKQMQESVVGAARVAAASPPTNAFVRSPADGVRLPNSSKMPVWPLAHEDESGRTASSLKVPVCPPASEDAGKICTPTPHLRQLPTRFPWPESNPKMMLAARGIQALGLASSTPGSMRVPVPGSFMSRANSPSNDAAQFPGRSFSPVDVKRAGSPAVERVTKRVSQVDRKRTPSPRGFSPASVRRTDDHTPRAADLSPRRAMEAGRPIERRSLGGRSSARIEFMEGRSQQQQQLPQSPTMSQAQLQPHMPSPPSPSPAQALASQPRRNPTSKVAPVTPRIQPLVTSPRPSRARPGRTSTGGRPSIGRPSAQVPARTARGPQTRSNASAPVEEESDPSPQQGTTAEVDHLASTSLPQPLRDVQEGAKAAAIIDLESRCHEDCGPEFTPEHEKENDAASFLLSVRDQEEYAPARRRTQEPLGICDGGPVTPPLNNHRRRSKAESDVSESPAQPAQWPTGAWAHASVLLDPSEQLPELFESFRTCRGVQSISQQFMKLLGASITHTGADLSSDTGQFSGSGMPLDVIRKAIGKQRRLAAMLWERLDARLHGADYLPKPLAGHKAVIVGSGPVGLRCALELRLLGAEVVVLERRAAYERINRLHLWKWCGEDLKGWGAKVLEPPELSFGSDPDFLHIGISELQELLLKAALLLGVQVFFGAEFSGSVPGEQWNILIGDAMHDSSGIRPGPPIPACLSGATILIGADGPRGSVARAHSFKLQESQGLRREAALGLVANYCNFSTASEKGRRPFSLARQFYEQLFKDCEEKTNVVLENIVCYISANTHYFVMTPTKKSLQNCGVIDADCKEGETLSSINSEMLATVAREIVALPWRTGDPVLPAEVLASPAGPPTLFDFSRQKRAAEGLQVVETSAGARMLVGLCGDALIEPFWPEGLGVVRGFFGALDVASAAKVWAETGHDSEAAVCHFEGAFRQLRSLAAKTRINVCKPDEKTYGLDPSTRYRYMSSGPHSRCESMPPLAHHLRCTSMSPAPRPPSSP